MGSIICGATIDNANTRQVENNMNTRLVETYPVKYINEATWIQKRMIYITCEAIKENKQHGTCTTPEGYTYMIPAVRPARQKPYFEVTDAIIQDILAAGVDLPSLHATEQEWKRAWMWTRADTSTFENIKTPDDIPKPEYCGAPIDITNTIYLAIDENIEERSTINQFETANNKQKQMIYQKLDSKTTSERLDAVMTSEGYIYSAPALRPARQVPFFEVTDDVIKDILAAKLKLPSINEGEYIWKEVWIQSTALKKTKNNQ